MQKQEKSSRNLHKFLEYELRADLRGSFFYLIKIFNAAKKYKNTVRMAVQYKVLSPNLSFTSFYGSYTQ